MYNNLTVCKQMMDVKLLLLHSNTQNHLTVWKEKIKWGAEFAEFYGNRGATHSITVIFVRSELSYQSSNPEWGYLYLT